MRTEEHSEASVGQIKEVILNFIQQRFQAKLEELQKKLDKLKAGENDIERNKLEAQRQQLVEEYQPATWVADAARRVGQIQQVTHALKYVHPEAKGTNLSSLGNSAAGDLQVGTHTNAKRVEPDVVGNAAALDVYKFMRLDIGGKTLLKRAAENDPALQAAFSNDAEQASAWMESFASITNSKGEPSSHTLAKQLYWPMEGDSYHLLAPLFPTSLVHQLWSTLREDRFSEETKAAREARRNDQPHSHGYREYPNVVIQQFGGTKPQNISQLNSERYGENHLLPSLPPQWNSDPIKPPLRVESVFEGWFGRRRRVRDLVQTLSGFLYSVQGLDRNNMHIRNKRIELVGYLVDEVLLFSAELQELDEPWTLHPDCKLNINEQCWLNPMRAQADPEFSSVYIRGDWQAHVCKRFGSWLNARLSDPKKPLPLGEVEAHEWRVSLEEGLDMSWLEVEHHA